jgi:azurin
MNKKLIVWALGLSLSLPLAFTSCTSNENSNSDEVSNNNNNNNNTSGATDTTAASNTNSQSPATNQPTNDNPVLHAVGNNMSEMHYDLSTIYLKAGNKIKLTLTNDGSDPSMIHNVVIVKDGTMQDVAMAGVKVGPDKDYVPADNPNVIAHTKMAKPTKTVTVEFTAPPAGNYQFFCSYPGHYVKMNGQVIVEP